MHAITRTLLVGTLACCAALLISGHAQAGPVVTVSIDFGQPGDTQSFAGQLTGEGNLHATGSGVGPVIKAGNQPFVFTEPFDHPQTVVSQADANVGVSFSTSPQSTPSSSTEFDFQDHALIDMRGVDVDLLSGVSTPFKITGSPLTTNSSNNLLKAIPFDQLGDLSSLQFTQTGAATLTPSDEQSGSFVLPGELHLQISNLRGFLFNLIDFEAGTNYAFTLPYQLSGDYSVTGPQSDIKVALDSASFSVEVPLAWQSKSLSLISTDNPPFTFLATTDLAMTLTVSGALHLEQSHLVIPEPASVVLLAVGLALTSGAFWMRRCDQVGGRQRSDS